MTTDYVEDEVSDTELETPATRWEARALELGTDPDAPERGGIILAALIALLLPLIIAGAILLPSSTPTEQDADGNVLESIGLDDITIAPAPDDNDGEQSTDVETIETEVDGATEVASVEIPEAPDEAPSESSAEPANADPAPTPIEPPATTVPASTTPATITPAPSTTGVSSTTPPSTAPTPADPPTSDSPSTTASPTTTTAVPTTTVPPTTTAPETTQPPDDEPDPPAFSNRVEIEQIGDTFVRYSFTAESTTSYAAVVRDENGIVATTTGTAVGGEQVSKSANGLLPGTDYTVRVRLLGPPEAASIAVPFRTSGGSPIPAEDLVEIENLQIVSIAETQVTVNYETNICANGSFVIRELGGEVVGRNGGQADGCTTRHLAIPGFWTPPLEPDTSYLLTITVEADGQGRGDGNVSTKSIVVTTAG